MTHPEPLPTPKITFIPLGVPLALQAIPRWVCWRYEIRAGKVTKVPYNARSGRKAASNRSNTWSTFDHASLAFARGGYAGVGIVLNGNGELAGLDLDECLDEEGQLALTAAEIVEEFDTYTERSPGGRGLRLFFQGKKPESAKCKFTRLIGVKAVEVFDNLRFLTVTGQAWADATPSIRNCQTQLDRLCARFWPTPPTGVALDGKIEITPAAGVSLSDDTLIEMAKSAKNGARFAALWAGDTAEHAGDDSAADLALCCHLAFWTGKDSARIDALFRRSGLYREKWDRNDYRERTIAKAIESCRETYQPQPQRSLRAGATPRPEIMLDTDEHRVADEVIDALASDPNLYQRGSILARIVRREGMLKGVQRPKDSPVISLLPKASLRERITEYCDLVAMTREGPESAHPPGWLVSAIDARGHWPCIRILNGISDVPVIRPDGTIWQDRGYDAATGVVFEPSIDFPLIPESPSQQDAQKAVEVLREVVCDFRFETDCHFAAWIASVLTPLGRQTLAGPTPIFLVDANVRGAGKGLLVHCVGEIVLGREMPVSTYSHDSDEMRKRITAIAIAGDPVILLDNVVGEFGNAAMDAALTTTVWQDRILGKSEMVRLPLTSVWYATGNNVIVGADTPRRLIHIRLDVMEEQPESRTDFKHPNLLKWVRANRGNLVGAALTILSAYLKAGAPPHGAKPMGSFEGWSETVRGAVMWAGLQDPCEGTRMMAESADSSRDVLGQLLDAIDQWDSQRNGFVVSELLQVLYGTDPRPGDAASVTMRAALEAMVSCPPGRVPTPRQVGNHLKSFRRRVVNGRYLDTRADERRSGGAVWRVSGGTESLNIPI